MLTAFQPPLELKGSSPAAIAAGKLANRFEPLFALAASSLLIILFTLFRDRLQIVLSAGTACAVYAVFQPGFLAVIPLLIVRWSLDILRSIGVTILIPLMQWV